MAMPPSGYKNWGDYCKEDPCFEPLKRSDVVAGVFEPNYYRCKYCDKKVPHDNLRPHLKTKTHDRKEDEYNLRRKRARLAKQSASTSAEGATASVMAATSRPDTVPVMAASASSARAESNHADVKATMAFIDSQPYDFAPEIIAAQQKDFYMMTFYNECLEVAETLVKEHMAHYDPTHDWAHVDRVRHTALRIARSLPKADFKVVEMAALFHDVAAKYTSSSTLKTTLAPFLNHESTHKALTPAQISNILDIVPAVSWTAEKALREKDGWTAFYDNWLELHAVQDADRLDAIGAVGIMRCAGFSAVKGRKLLDDGDGAGSAEEHFEEKLFKIKDRMKTPFGWEEAGRRHETMVAWMSALQAEKAVCDA